MVIDADQFVFAETHDHQLLAGVNHIRVLSQQSLLVVVDPGLLNLVVQQPTQP